MYRTDIGDLNGSEVNVLRRQYCRLLRAGKCFAHILMSSVTEGQMFGTDLSVLCDRRTNVLHRS
jgi:hypothetical protein